MLDNSILVTGTVNLANAALNGLMAVIFVVCLCFFTYYWMRRAHSEEMGKTSVYCISQFTWWRAKCRYFARDFILLQY